MINAGGRRHFFSDFGALSRRNRNTDLIGLARSRMCILVMPLQRNIQLDICKTFNCLVRVCGGEISAFGVYIISWDIVIVSVSAAGGAET